MGYSQINNPCDLIVYKNGTLNLFECKAIHGNTLTFKSHVRENQWQKMLDYSKLPEDVKNYIHNTIISLQLNPYLNLNQSLHQELTTMFALSNK